MRVAPLSIRLALLATVASAATPERPETRNHAVVEVIARDSTGAPVPQAEVTVTRGLHATSPPTASPIRPDTRTS